MIALLRADLTDAARREARHRVEQAASAAGARLPAQGLGDPGWVEIAPPAGAADALASLLAADDAVLTILDGDRPTWHVARGEKSLARIEVGPARFGAGAVSAIAGPCAVESESELLALALQLREAGATALRGGAFKPRTSPYSFQGLGEEGLAILAAVSLETGLPVVTEVMDPREVGLVAEHAAVLQIGSRSMQNFALLREAGAAGRPVLLKRGMSATLAEFLLAAEYLAHAGCREILLCERGLRHFDPAVRNLLDLAAIPALRKETHLPVIVDPSHGTGRADLVGPMLAAAAAAGADGFLVEVHGQPASSVSDAGQALAPAAFARHLATVEAVLAATGRRLERLEPASAGAR